MEALVLIFAQLVSVLAFVPAVLLWVNSRMRILVKKLKNRVFTRFPCLVERLSLEKRYESHSGRGWLLGLFFTNLETDGT
jgi:hypothetical protein